MKLSRTRGLLPKAALLLIVLFFTAYHSARSQQQEYFQGMVQIFGNEEGAAYVNSQQWTAVTKTLYTYMNGEMFRPQVPGTVREYYLVIRKADDIYDCAQGPSFRFWFTHMGKAGHEFAPNLDWGSIDAGNVKWYKVPSNIDQAYAVYQRDGGGSPNYWDYYFRLDAKLPASCPADRRLRIFSIYIAAIDKVTGGSSAAINLNNDPVATQYPIYTLGAPGGGLLVTQENISSNTLKPVTNLDMNGTLTAKKVKVTMNGWSDFVLKENYPLRSLEDLEQFIKIHQHLPDVPSEKEVLAQGNDLGEMDKKLLQKIEELTLYMIELKKENATIRRELEELKK